jgi:tetratricopeptide (TPR) repeat protein
MYKIQLSLFLLLLSISKSFACLNGETKILKNGILVYEDYEGLVPYGHHFYKEKYQVIINELLNTYKKTKDLDYLSDVGYVLIIQGKYKEALNMYLNIEKLKPYRYTTASNIGTLYELIGDNKNAIKWIKKAFAINPKSHSESEWIHIKILETKISNNKNINGESIIGTSFGKETIPKTKLDKKQRDKLIKALYYQLNERVTFIKPNDEIIGALLFELGSLVMINKDLNSSRIIFSKSLEYGNTNPLLANRFLKVIENHENEIYTENERLINQNLDIKNNLEEKILPFKLCIFLSAIIIAILSFIIFRLKRKIKQNINS